MEEKKEKVNDVLDRFLPYVFKRDEASAVLKSHLFLEQTLDKLIIHVSTNPEIVLKGSFREKTDFLYSVGGITPYFRECLLFVNSIRNKFSHRFDYEIAEDDLKGISQLVGDSEIPDSLLTFPRAREALLFSTAVALLNQILELLLDTNEKLTTKIINEAVDRVLRKRKK